MALGGVDTTIATGGGRASPSLADQSKTIIAFGVSPDGAVETLYSFSSPPAVRTALARGSTGGPLAEFCAKLLQHDAPQVYACPVDMTSHTAMSTPTVTGTGTGTLTVADRPHKALRILCTANGVAGVGAKFKFSSDGGTTYSAEVSWADSGGGSFVYRPSGWFVTLTFPASNYVANETATFPINSGTRSDSGGWVGAVTAAVSVIDDYRVRMECIRGGAHNSGDVVFRVSLDGGITTLPDIAVGTGAVFAIPQTGIAVTLTGGTFAAGDVIEWKCVSPTYATADLQDALDAAMEDASSPTVATVWIVGLNDSAADTITQTATVQTRLDTANSTHGKQWRLGVVNGPSSSAGDTIRSGGTATTDTADTDTVIRAALTAATETNNVSTFWGTQEQVQALSGLALRRPISWAVAARYVETEMRIDPTWRALGALDLYTSATVPLRRDERLASVALHDAKGNAIQSVPGRSGAYLAMQKGGVGWRNMTTDASYQHAAGVRCLMVYLAAVTDRAQNYVGQDVTTNADGTITEREAAQIDGELNAVGRRAVGIAKGGSFPTPQAVTATATVDRASNLGTSPRELIVGYVFQPRGLITHVNQRVTYSGALSVTE